MAAGLVSGTSYPTVAAAASCTVGRTGSSGRTGRPLGTCRASSTGAPAERLSSRCPSDQQWGRRGTLRTAARAGLGSLSSGSVESLIPDAVVRVSCWVLFHLSSHLGVPGTPGGVFQCQQVFCRTKGVEGCVLFRGPCPLGPFLQESVQRGGDPGEVRNEAMVP
jgi:hypothetical protein